MTSELKCPVCNHKLYQTASEPATYCCLYKDCQSDFKFAGSKELWQALIQAKQDLEQYKHKDNLQQQLNANNNQIQEKNKQIVEIDGRIIENLEKDLEIAREALGYYADSRFGKKQDDGTYVLEIDKGCGVTVVYTYDPRLAKQALEHIEHKK